MSELKQEKREEVADQTGQDLKSINPPHETSSTPSPSRQLGFASYGYTFGFMFVIWIIFSGKFDLFHLTLGCIACGLVSYFSADLLLSAPLSHEVVKLWFRVVLYLPWLLYQIFLSNLHLLKLVFHPRMMELIDPRIIEFQSKIKDTIGIVTFANSITLTPGTITVYVSVYGKFSVHAIDRHSRDPLPGEMEDRIAAVFEA